MPPLLTGPQMVHLSAAPVFLAVAISSRFEGMGSSLQTRFYP
jgi:hypothetical protein